MASWPEYPCDPDICKTGPHRKPVTGAFCIADCDDYDAYLQLKQRDLLPGFMKKSEAEQQTTGC